MSDDYDPMAEIEADLKAKGLDQPIDPAKYEYSDNDPSFENSDFTESDDGPPNFETSDVLETEEFEEPKDPYEGIFGEEDEPVSKPSSGSESDDITQKIDISPDDLRAFERDVLSEKSPELAGELPVFDSTPKYDYPPKKIITITGREISLTPDKDKRGGK